MKKGGWHKLMLLPLTWNSFRDPREGSIWDAAGECTVPSRRSCRSMHNAGSRFCTIEGNWWEFGNTGGTGFLADHLDIRHYAFSPPRETVRKKRLEKSGHQLDTSCILALVGAHGLDAERTGSEAALRITPRPVLLSSHSISERSTKPRNVVGAIPWIYITYTRHVFAPAVPRQPLKLLSMKTRALVIRKDKVTSQLLEALLTPDQHVLGRYLSPTSLTPIPMTVIMGDPMFYDVNQAVMSQRPRLAGASWAVKPMIYPRQQPFRPWSRSSRPRGCVTWSN
ncbi:hypothetical protein V8F33_007764 [Rhypophila sp. PSN 637]